MRGPLFNFSSDSSTVGRVVFWLTEEHRASPPSVRFCNLNQEFTSSFGTACTLFEQRLIAHLSSLFSLNLSIHIHLTSVLLHLFDLCFLHDS